MRYGQCLKLACISATILGFGDGDVCWGVWEGGGLTASSSFKHCLPEFDFLQSALITAQTDGNLFFFLVTKAGQTLNSLAS